MEKNRKVNISAKLDTFMRIKGSTTLEEYDRLRVTFTGEDRPGIPFISCINAVDM